MFIDYLVLMLVNMTGALLTIAAFLICGLNSEKPQKWAAPFLVSGFIALACGLHMVWNWPLPGPFNVAFGETTVLFGGVLLGAGIALAAGWNLLPLAIPAFVAGAAAVLTGMGIIRLELTGKPLISGIGFILTGLCGVFAVLPLAYPKQWVFRYVGAAVVFAAAVIWASTAYLSIPSHMKNFKQYTPPGMAAKK